ncbi:MAG: autotransporter-associated beta strand repeat-containing protein [Pirellulales bacterium]|nr:autotransporter-associated beta strand repeat-containing protein [Pirellulales bacterium]
MNIYSFRVTRVGTWLVAFAIGAAALSPTGRAEMIQSWVGSTNTTWSTATNWSPSGAPGSTENAKFDNLFTGSNQPKVTASTTINGIWMASDVTKSVAITRTSPGALTITPTDTINGIAGLGLLVEANSGSYLLTLSLPIALGADQEWRNETATTVDLRNSATTISGSGNLTLRSTGADLFSAFRVDARAETFTGQLTVAEGTYRISSVNNVSANGPLGNADSSKPIVLGDGGSKLGYLRLSDSTTDLSTDKPFTLANDGRGGFWVGPTSGTTLTLSGTISGGGMLVKMGAGDDNAPSTLELTNTNNDWTGGTLVTDGYVSVPAGNVLGNGTITLDYNDQYVTNSDQGHSNVAGIKFTGDTTIDSAGVTARSLVINPGVGGVGGNLEVAATFIATLAGDAALSGSGSLRKTGDGTLAITGNSSFAGNTTISNGTLLVNGTHTGGGAYTVESNATLGGTGTIHSSVLVNASGNLAPGASIGTLAVDSADFDGNLIIEYNGDVGTIDRLDVVGALDITDAILDFDNLGTAVLSGGPHIFASYGSLVGTQFASLLDSPAGYSIDCNYLGGNQIALVASGVVPGDYNGDHIVDSADYVIWRKTNINGPQGYLDWRSHFGETTGAGVGHGELMAASVPEPASLASLLGFVVALVARRHGVRRNRLN